MLNSSHYINHGGQFTSNIVQLDCEFQTYINPQTFKCVRHNPYHCTELDQGHKLKIYRQE